MINIVENTDVKSPGVHDILIKIPRDNADINKEGAYQR